MLRLGATLRRELVGRWLLRGGGWGGGAGGGAGWRAFEFAKLPLRVLLPLALPKGRSDAGGGGGGRVCVCGIIPFIILQKKKRCSR